MKRSERRHVFLERGIHTADYFVGQSLSIRKEPSGLHPSPYLSSSATLTKEEAEVWVELLQIFIKDSTPER